MSKQNKQTKNQSNTHQLIAFRNQLETTYLGKRILVGIGAQSIGETYVQEIVGGKDGQSQSIALRLGPTPDAETGTWQDIRSLVIYKVFTEEENLAKLAAQEKAVNKELSLVP